MRRQMKLVFLGGDRHRRKSRGRRTEHPNIRQKLFRVTFCVTFCVTNPVCCVSRHRLNRLQSVVVGEAGLLSHVAQLDVRDAGLRELDVRSLSRLELLRCDRNALTLLRVAGRALKSLHAAHNGGSTRAHTNKHPFLC